MTISPGKPGEPSDRSVDNLRQVAGLSQRSPGKWFVQADGAVSQKTRDLFVQAQAMALIAGYPIFPGTTLGKQLPN